MVSGRLRRSSDVFLAVLGAQQRKANDLLRVCEPLRILLLLAALGGCVFYFASSGTALCCYVYLSCGTVIYDLAGFRSCSGSLLVQPLLQNICTSVGSLSMLQYVGCDVFMFLWFWCLSLEVQRDRLSP